MYYKNLIQDGIAEKFTSKSTGPLTKPTFFGACLKDVICVAPLMIASMKKTCTNLTVKEYDSGHFVMLDLREEVNKDLEEWLKGL
jgi:soluble epoxide hydrolase / lipid-phosphate phosphatase